MSYPFEDLRGTHAATCDRVVLVHIKAINLAQSGCVENGIGQVTVEGLRMDFVPIHILDISL